MFYLCRCQKVVQERPKKEYFKKRIWEAVQQVSVGINRVKLSLRKTAAEKNLLFKTLQRYVKKERNKANSNEAVQMRSIYESCYLCFWP